MIIGKNVRVSVNSSGFYPFLTLKTEGLEVKSRLNGDKSGSNLQESLKDL